MCKGCGVPSKVHPVRPWPRPGAGPLKLRLEHLEEDGKAVVYVPAAAVEVHLVVPPQWRGALLTIRARRIGRERRSWWRRLHFGRWVWRPRRRPPPPRNPPLESAELSLEEAVGVLRQAYLDLGGALLNGVGRWVWRPRRSRR